MRKRDRDIDVGLRRLTDRLAAHHHPDGSQARTRAVRSESTEEW
jgi:hypothetical protein